MVGWYGSDDECAICVHEHENWGDNEHCRKCRKEEKEKQKKNDDKVLFFGSNVEAYRQ